MIFENSQDTFEINLPENIKKVGMKISGGADSAITCYMLAKYCKEERPDITIYPITGIAEGKAYQEIFAKRVLSKIEELLDYKFGPHTAEDVRADENYSDDQNIVVEGAYNKYGLDIHFAGITANPYPHEAPELFDVPEGWLPSDDRSKSPNKKSHPEGRSIRPLINVDKRGVKEHYENLGVLDTLFPVTRSCEEYTEDFSKHCGWCWFCMERKWGFGKL